ETAGLRDVVVLDGRLEVLAGRDRLPQLTAQPAEEAHLRRFHRLSVAWLSRERLLVDLDYGRGIRHEPRVVAIERVLDEVRERALGLLSPADPGGRNRDWRDVGGGGGEEDSERRVEEVAAAVVGDLDGDVVVGNVAGVVVIELDASGAEAEPLDDCGEGKG